MWCVRRLRGVVCAGEGEASTAPPPALLQLPQLLQAQYEHEEPALRTGTHLLHTHYLKVTASHILCVVFTKFRRLIQHMHYVKVIPEVRSLRLLF